MELHRVSDPPASNLDESGVMGHTFTMCWQKSYQVVSWYRVYIPGVSLSWSVTHWGSRRVFKARHVVTKLPYLVSHHHHQRQNSAAGHFSDFNPKFWQIATNFLYPGSDSWSMFFFKVKSGRCKNSQCSYLILSYLRLNLSCICTLLHCLCAAQYFCRESEPWKKRANSSRAECWQPAKSSLQSNDSLWQKYTR